MTQDEEQPTAAIVRSRVFLFVRAGEEDTPETPLGKDFADFLEKSLAAHGAEVTGASVPGEGGWTFDARLRGDEYRIFILWAPIGDPPEDCWVIQFDRRRPLLRVLFGRTPSPTEVAPIVALTHIALNDAAEIQRITWLSRRALAGVY